MLISVVEPAGVLPGSGRQRRAGATPYNNRLSEYLNNILFISLSNIGDAVMTTPALHELHRRYPQAEIDIVAGPRSLQVFRHCPYRGEIYLKDKQKFLRGYPSLLRQLRRSRYDLAVDLRTDGFTWFLKADRRCNKQRGRVPGQHAVEEHLAVIRDLVEPGPAPATYIWLTEEQKKHAESLLGDSGRYLAIGPGCGGPEKIWPPERFAALARGLREHFSGTVLLGGPGDRTYAEQVQQHMQGRILDLTGKTDILQAAALIQKCSLFVGNDSGLGHVASAVATPTLTLFGVGEPERYHPWQERAAWLVGREREILNISTDEVLQTARGLLQ